MKSLSSKMDFSAVDKKVLQADKFPSFGTQMLNNNNLDENNQARSRVMSGDSFGSPNQESHVDTPTLVSDKETLRIMNGFADPRKLKFIADISKM